MAITREFRETIQARVRTDLAFRKAMLCEGVEHLLSGDVESGKITLRNYIKATGGFEQLGAETGEPSKSLIRMFGPRGNPQARNLFTVISHLQRQAGLTLCVTTQQQ